MPEAIKRQEDEFKRSTPTQKTIENSLLNSGSAMDKSATRRYLYAGAGVLIFAAAYGIWFISRHFREQQVLKPKEGNLYSSPPLAY